MKTSLIKDSAYAVSKRTSFIGCSAVDNSYFLDIQGISCEIKYTLPTFSTGAGFSQPEKAHRQAWLSKASHSTHFPTVP